MERYRVIGSVDNFDGQQNLDEWIQMIERAAEFAGWTANQSFKAALFRLRGEAGEFAEQLRDEEKVKTWEDLKTALKDRYNTAGKEQWHQYLLNTATQGSKTVQEWAQTVRKLSIKALGEEGKEKEPKEEQDRDRAGEEGQEREEEEAGDEEAPGRPAPPALSEARKKLLDYTRKSNFIRGLRSSLRKMVWRKKCKTFDEAVRAAAEEEVVEASHREEEVLSYYKRDPPVVTNQGLVEQIIAAIQITDEMKKKNKTEEREVKERTGRDERDETNQTRHDHAADTRQGMTRNDPGSANRTGPYPAANGSYYANATTRENQQPYNGRRYGEQLPLPRGGYRGPAPGRRPEWSRQEWRNTRGQTNANYGSQPGNRRVVNCYYCGKSGHIQRDCRTRMFEEQGNDNRRLQ